MSLRAIVGLGLALAATTTNAAEPVKIGLVYGFTGANAVSGQDARRGSEMAIDAVNAAGGITSMGGAKIEALFGDSQSKPVNAVGEAERMITQDKIAMLLGTGTSTETIPMSQVAEKYGVPHLNTVAQHESITGRGFKWVWSQTLIDSDYVAGIVEALAEVRRLNPALTTVGLVHGDNDYGLEMAKSLKAVFERRSDVKLVTAIPYSMKSQDYGPTVLKLRAAQPQIVVQVGYFRDGVLMARAYEQHDFHPVVIGTGGMSGDPKLVNEIGKLTEGQISVSPFNADLPRAKLIAAEFGKRFGQPMTLNAALGYQSIMVVKEVLERAGKTDPAALAKAFAEIDIPGERLITASDKIRFGADGRNVGRATVITQFQGGEVVTVGPPSKAQAKLHIRAFNTH